MNDTKKILLIGTGRAGMLHAHNYAARVPGASLSAVCDADALSARAAAETFGIDRCYTDYRKAIDEADIDAVIVVTPTKYHHEITLYAANAGKHIFCEKPMAMTVGECDDMIRAAQENNVILQIGFMRRFDKNYRRAKEIIQNGDIGAVVSIRSMTHGPSVPKPWMYDIAKSNGPLAEVCSHDIDTVRYFSQSDVVSLYALAGNYRCPEARAEYPDFYDTVLMNVRLANGGIGLIDGAQGVQYGYDARTDILGETGMITIGGLQDGTTLCHTREKGMVGQIVHSWTDLFSQAYTDEALSFIRCIQTGEPPLVSGRDGRQAVAVVAAGNESIRTNQIIMINGETMNDEGC